MNDMLNFIIGQFKLLNFPILEGYGSVKSEDAKQKAYYEYSLFKRNHNHIDNGQVTLM